MTDALIDKARELAADIEWKGSPTSAIVVRALIARLEAAEKVCKVTNDYARVGAGWIAVEEQLETWRALRGAKEGAR